MSMHARSDTPGDEDAKREKRRKQRREFVHHLPVRDSSSGRLIGLLTNLTGSGMMLVSEFPLRVGKVLDVDLMLPEPIEGRSRIGIRMQCRWCHRRVNRRDFESGFRFVDTSFRQKLLLEALLTGEEIEDGVVVTD